MENTEKVYVICGTQGKGLTYFSTQSHKDRENGKMGGGGKTGRTFTEGTTENFQN